DVPVVESLLHFQNKNPLQQPQIDDEPRSWIDAATHCHFTHIRVTVIALPCAEAKHLLVLLVTPIGATIPMRSGKGDPSSEARGQGNKAGMKTLNKEQASKVTKPG